ncbi:predicted protein [Uncinocarpus reesii 1704]|uniref:Nibrin second BRCT domain-containing protein n=1 Tax=Uncinocarpus reesii (strain UAMH 1704) TaxID=336963 RepID=C4JFQ6_UNCRE|nr:uncharacterized protein UREG_02390 [Uncinocarpus reesii 1704]EEP77541.1 predicted protein [Uncinocarpus reesii 1704]
MRHDRRWREITWCPVVLTFSYGSQDSQDENPLIHAQSRLEDLDIKTVIQYLPGKTSYVVQKRRNTAKGLQALINGKHIVEPAYIEHIVYAATSTELEREEALCPLEQDFDAAWPDPIPHLPPRGKEKIDLPDSAYNPDPRRSGVFEGYTFVICDESKWEELQGVITDGHGKAWMSILDLEIDPAEHAQDFVLQAARWSGKGEFGRDCEVVLVKPRKKNNSEWFDRFENEVNRLTGQQFIEPGELLDAILRNDASRLYKQYQPPIVPAPAAQSQDQAMGHTAESAAFRPVETAEESQRSSRPAKRPRTQAYVPKFKNFDDGFDMESIPTYNLELEEASEEPSQSLAVDSMPDQSMQDREISDADDGVSELLPGATAMRHHFRGRARPVASPVPQPQRRTKKPKLDVIEAARQHREAEDRAALARQEEEKAAAIVDGMDLSRLQNLAIIEEMPVFQKVRQDRPSNGHGDRWDDRWNGRKNFKKFRRKGQGGALHRVQTVIVPLEEVKKKDFGIGDDYWSHNNNSSTRTERNRSVVQESNDTMLTSQPISQSAESRTTTRSRKRSRTRDSDSDDDGLRFRFRRKKKR